MFMTASKCENTCFFNTKEGLTVREEQAAYADIRYTALLAVSTAAYIVSFKTVKYRTSYFVKFHFVNT